jgi:hypothetical protein
MLINNWNVFLNMPTMLAGGGAAAAVYDNSYPSAKNNKSLWRPSRDRFAFCDV